MTEIICVVQQGKRRKTSETLESLESTSYAISRLGNTDNQQKLVKRNEYLEKRVKQLEKLNFELQYGNLYYMY